MAKRWKKEEAFAYFNGATCRNFRWSWSARSSDGRTIVVTLWEDRLKEDGSKVTTCEPGDDNGQLRHGNKERIENLLWARDHCGGLFNVVVVVGKEREDKPGRRKTVRHYPHESLIMRLVSLDEDTGEFTAESVSR